MKTQIDTTKAPGAIGPYSQAVKAGNLIFVSGQLPINPADGTMGECINARHAKVLKTPRLSLKKQVHHSMM